MEEMSRTLFHILDYIGYNQEVIRLRRNYWQQDARIFNAGHQGIHVIVAGSKGEGITSHFESDIDQMFLLNNTICTDVLAHVAGLRDMTVLYADTSETPPGYSRLKLISRIGAHARSVVLESIFESELEGIYLSSTLFASHLQRFLLSRQGENTNIYGDISGPAVQSTTAGKFPLDTVLAFHCYNPEILQSWKSRPRRHEWPPEDVREEAASVLAQVVPVGCKGSCDQWREWRFCFIQTELQLTCSLNETQLKLYILLKMVAKEVLCHVSKEISSYIMKNVTYWLSELLPGRVFRRENLLRLLILSLRFLQSAISKWYWFPYYMIPSRNLLAERLTPANRRQLSVLIESLIEEGPSFILRCAKLRKGLSFRLTAPVVLLKYRETRDRVELLIYCKRLLQEQNVDSYYVSECNEEIYSTVLPGWKTLLGRGISVNEIIDEANQRIKALLL